VTFRAVLLILGVGIELVFTLLILARRLRRAR
jgi:hypothetical protein